MSDIITVDFSKKDGQIRKELYGSGLHIFTATRYIKDTTEESYI